MSVFRQSLQQIFKISEKMAIEFFISHTTVTFNKGHGHSKRYQNVDFCGLYH